MTSTVDFSKICPIVEMRGEDREETLLLEEMFKCAKNYLESFDWCERISEAWFGLGVGGVVAVFLFEILPKTHDVDEWLWVIAGNFPPAYIVTDYAPNPACALKEYMREMKEWVLAVKSGRSVDELIPVNASATIENAEDLDRRIAFLTREILLPFHSSDLKACSAK